MKITTWICVLLLIVIHSIDIELTRYYIGNDADSESFPPMRLSIRLLGGEMSGWLSRLVMYSYFWFALMNYEKKGWFYFLVLVTFLYWTAMIGWLFSLQLVPWPLPKDVMCY